jgi:hypothetical protein
MANERRAMVVLDAHRAANQRDTQKIAAAMALAMEEAAMMAADEAASAAMEDDSRHHMTTEAELSARAVAHAEMEAEEVDALETAGIVAEHLMEGATAMEVLQRQRIAASDAAADR